AARLRRLASVVSHAGRVPHVWDAELKVRIPRRPLEPGMEVRQGRQARCVEAGYQSAARHWSQAAVSGKNNIPPRVAGHHLREHLLIALVSSVPYPDAALMFEPRQHRRIDVRRPVVNVQTWTAVPRARAHQRRGDKHSPLHCLSAHNGLPPRCSRCDITMMAPKATTISADTAFTTGLTPRRAIA